MSGNEQDAAEVEQMDKYRTAPLRFPLHVLDPDGDPLCGTMADDQRMFVDRHGVESQPTLRENKGETRLMHFLSNLCGNCKRSLFSEDGADPLKAVEEERKRAIESVKA